MDLGFKLGEDPSGEKQRAILYIGSILGLFILVLSLGSTNQSQSETLMQCMKKCIREAGQLTNANKEMCKTRCAVATYKSQPPSMRDCMGEYKNCRKQCDKDKKCQRKCKKRQMTCQ